MQKLFLDDAVMSLGQQLLLVIIPGTIIAIITSFITVSLSLRRFYSEKWWERKAEAYSAIIESLYHVKRNLDALMLSVEKGDEFKSPDRLASKSREGYERIYREAGVGAFIISEKAAQVLESLLSDIQKPKSAGMSFLDYLQDHAARVVETLDSLRKIAKRDLKIG